MLTEKYGSVIDLANTLGITGLNVVESDGVLTLSGAAASAGDVQQLTDEALRIDQEGAASEIELNVTDTGTGSRTVYTVKGGDTLSGIGRRYGISWQEIFEANRHILDDPDVIKPGQELYIPGV